MVLAEGLKSREQLGKEGKSEKRSSMYVLSDQYKNIYFRVPGQLEQIDSESFISRQLSITRDWVAITVDPSKTYVFNSELRAPTMVARF